MIELTEAERELLSYLAEYETSPEEAKQLNALLARDAEARGKVAVSREGLASLVHKARIGQEQDGNYTHHCDCEQCVKANADIAEAEAALKEGE